MRERLALLALILIVVVKGDKLIVTKNNFRKDSRMEYMAAKRDTLEKAVHVWM